MYEELLTVLNRQKVRYLVVGGVAVNLYGIERMTGDIDIIIEMSPANLERFLDAAQMLKLKPSIPVKYKDIADVYHLKRRREVDSEEQIASYQKVPVRTKFLMLEESAKFFTKVKRARKQKSSRTISPSRNK